jgi:asparagine synthase (glutamine-hydrolysing)
VGAIGGLLRFENAQPASRVICEMIARLKRRTNAKVSLLGFGRFTCVHLSNRPATSVQQTLQHPGGLVCFNGRLDNRAELIQELELPCLSGEQAVSDAQLILTASLRWGCQFSDRLLGDFAAALWNSESQTLIMIRDTFGVAPLYYSMSAECIAFASYPEALPFVDLSKINKTFLAGYFIDEPDEGSSAFADITAVPPGGRVTFQDGRIQVKTGSWIESLEESRRIEVSDPEAEEEYRRLFLDAVRGRLRSQSGTVTLLSGGLDSSSIACTIPAVGSRFFATASFVFDKARDADERYYITAVEKQIGQKGFHLLEDSQPVLSMNPDPDFISVPSPIMCFGGRIDQINQTLSNVGTDVLITGTYGDHVQFSDGSEACALADHLRSGRFVRFFQEAYEWSAIRKRSLFPIVYESARALSRISIHDIDTPEWLHPQIKERLLGAENGRRSRRLAPLLAAMRNAAGGHASYQNTKKLFEIRYPYLHKPLVEFLFRLPIHQLHRPGDNRSLLRRAMRGTLPEVVLHRKNKTGPGAALYRALQNPSPYLRSLFDRPRSFDAGIVVPKEICEEFRRARHGQIRYLADFLRYVSVEIWLRNLEQKRETSCAQIDHSLMREIERRLHNGDGRETGTLLTA